MVCFFSYECSPKAGNVTQCRISVLFNASDGDQLAILKNVLGKPTPECTLVDMNSSNGNPLKHTVLFVV